MMLLSKVGNTRILFFGGHAALQSDVSLGAPFFFWHASCSSIKLNSQVNRVFMKACYAITKTRSFSGAITTISLVMDDSGSQYLSFSTPEEARAWMRKLAARKHDFQQKDIAPPTYAVTEVGGENFKDAYKCTWSADS